MTARAAIFAGACLLGLSGQAANAVPLNPNDFAGSSLGLLTGGAITLDTDALTFNGGAGGNFVNQGGVPFGEGVGGPPGIAVFLFDDGSVLGDVTITGSNAAAILFLGSATVSGSIDVSAEADSFGSSGGAGGAGGGQGGRGFSGLSNPAPETGFGPGGGERGNVNNNSFSNTPGGGGGFGTPGGAGASNIDGGSPYGDLTVALQGGSGGGGGGGFQGAFFNGGSGGGGGGGALEIGAIGSLVFDGALVVADGGNSNLSFHGNGNARVGGGGGSGGGLLFHGFDISVDVDTIITADGGNGGGQGGTVGGCGGGGLITFLSNTAGSFANDGLVRADPGSGVGVCDPLSTNVSFLTSSDIGEDPNQSGSGTSVPEPASGLLLAAGLAGLMLRRRKKR